MTLTDNLTTIITTVAAVLATSIIAPLSMLFFTTRAARATAIVDAVAAKALKQQDWDRQDAVADKAEKAAQALIDLNTKTADSAAASARHAAELSTHIVNVTEMTHALINSNYSTVLRAQYEAMVGKLWALKVASSSANTKDADTARALIGPTETSIAELQIQIDSRTRAQEDQERATALKGSAISSVDQVSSPT